MSDQSDQLDQPESTMGNPVVGQAGPPNEAYGQGETHQFSPQGAASGIGRQDKLRSQQYEREREAQEREGDILGTFGRAVAKLFGGDGELSEQPESPREAE